MAKVSRKERILSCLNVFTAINHNGILLGQTDGPKLQGSEYRRRSVDVISVGGAGVEQSGCEESSSLDGQRGEFVHATDNVTNGVDVRDVSLLINHWDIASGEE